MNKASPSLVLLLSLVGILISCQDSSSVYSSSLRYADSLMEVSPDHVLNYLHEFNDLHIQKMIGSILVYF